MAEIRRFEGVWLEKKVQNLFYGFIYERFFGGAFMPKMACHGWSACVSRALGGLASRRSSIPKGHDPNIKEWRSHIRKRLGDPICQHALGK